MKRQRLKKGLIQVYTGNGKGKTSAAFGLGLRAVGRGLRVYVIQFIKGGFDYGELHIAGRLPNFEIAAFGRGQFINRESPTEEDVIQVRKAMDRARKVVGDGEYDIVVLDEVNVVLDYGLIGVEEMVDLMRNKPGHVEIVLTGRGAPDEIIELADLVTEMREIKHPYNQGIGARKGIEY